MRGAWRGHEGRMEGAIRDLLTQTTTTMPKEHQGIPG